MARWGILRVPAGAVLSVELLCGKWLRLATHYAGRTVLCTESEQCPLCDFLAVRSFWYLPIVQLPGRRPKLLELSSHGSADLEMVGKMAFGSLGPGCRFDLTRRSTKAPVRSEAGQFVATPERVSPQVWISALMAIYQLPQLHASETIDAYSERVRSRLVDRAEALANRLRAGQKR